MTSPTDRDEAPPDAPSPDASPPDAPSPDAPSPDAPTAQQATASPPQAVVASRDSSGDKLVRALLVALLGLFGADLVYTGNQIQALRDEVRASEERQSARIDELVAQLRDSEARQIQRVDELAHELRAEIRAEVRASEERQNSRIDELAAELRAAMDVLADIQARLVRLETTAGLPPLPVAPPSTAPADDN